MTKKSAITKFTLIIVFSLIGAILALVCCNLPFSTSKWNSFVGGLNFNNEVDSGVEVIYDFELASDEVELNEASKQIKNDIYSTLTKYYTQPNVALIGNNIFQIQVGSSDNYNDNNRVEMALSSVGGNNKFIVTAGDDILNINNVESASYVIVSGADCLKIKFKNNAKDKLEQMSKTGLLSVSFKDGQTSSPIDVSEPITNGVLELYWNGESNKASIVATILNLQLEQDKVNLTYASSDIITASLHNNFALIFAIALACVLFVCLVLMCIKYRLFGIVSLCSTILFLAIYTLFLNILPNIQISVGSLIGIALSFIIMNFSTIFLCEKIVEFNKNGKKTKTAFEFAYKKLLKFVLDLSFVLLIPAFVLIFVGSSEINSFCIALCVGLLVNLLISLVVTKESFKSIIKIMGKNNKAFNLKKEVLEDENV